MALSRDKILKHSGVFTTTPVHVPAWADESGDDVVLVRAMTVREFEVNQGSVGKDDGKATAALLARCILDESGGRLFTDKDVDAIAEIGLKEINRVAKVIVELSGLSDDKDADADGEAQDGDEGKAPAEPSAAPGSPSPLISLAGSSTG